MRLQFLSIILASAFDASLSDSAPRALVLRGGGRGREDSAANISSACRVCNLCGSRYVYLKHVLTSISSRCRHCFCVRSMRKIFWAGFGLGGWDPALGILLYMSGTPGKIPPLNSRGTGYLSYSQNFSVTTLYSEAGPWLAFYEGKAAMHIVDKPPYAHDCWTTSSCVFTAPNRVVLLHAES